MNWSREELDIVFDKTRGYCTYCGTGLVGSSCVEEGTAPGTVGAWRVEEWEPMVSSDPFRSAWPVCCSCLAEKGTRSPDAYVVSRFEKGLPILRTKWRLFRPSWPAY